MSDKFMNILLICIFLVASNGTAQEAVSSNGKFATINGLKIYYEESGKGMPVILLHHFLVTASQWKTYVPELAKKYRVIAVDLRDMAGLIIWTRQKCFFLRRLRNILSD
jgi:hypothetical protein